MSEQSDNREIRDLCDSPPRFLGDIGDALRGRQVAGGHLRDGRAQDFAELPGDAYMLALYLFELAPRQDGRFWDRLLLVYRRGRGRALRSLRRWHCRRWCRCHRRLRSAVELRCGYVLGQGEHSGRRGNCRSCTCKRPTPWVTRSVVKIWLQTGNTL